MYLDMEVNGEDFRVPAERLVGVAPRLGVVWEMTANRRRAQGRLSLAGVARTVLDRAELEEFGLSGSESLRVWGVPQGFPVPGLGAKRSVRVHRWVDHRTRKRYGTVEVAAGKDLREFIGNLSRAMGQRPNTPGPWEAFDPTPRTWADVWGDHTGWHGLLVVRGTLQHGADS